MEMGKLPQFVEDPGSISFKRSETISRQLLSFRPFRKGIVSFQSGSYSNRPLEGQAGKPRRPNGQNQQVDQVLKFQNPAYQV